MPAVPDSHVVLVLFGDVPLVRSDALAALVDDARKGSLALLTVLLDDPTGYGRVVRDARGRVATRGGAEGCERRGKARARMQHRRDGRARGPDARVAVEARQCECAGRVLPDRRHRDGREAARGGDAARGHGRSGRARRQRSPPARAARGRAALAPRGAAVRSRRDDRGSHAPRRARQRRHRSRRLPRRGRGARRPRRARRQRAHRTLLPAARRDARRRHRSGGAQRARRRDGRGELPHRSRSRGCAPVQSLPATCTSATTSK